MTVDAIAAVPAFLLSLALPLAVREIVLRVRREPVRITIDPEDPDPRRLAEYFATVAMSMDERPRRMRLTVDARNSGGMKVELDMDRTGAMLVNVEGRRRRRLDLRRRWIADHPVPLCLWSRRHPRRLKRLYLDPVEGNRFRVRECIQFLVPWPFYALCSILAAVGVLFLSPVAMAVAAGFASGAYLCGRQSVIFF